MKEMKKILFFMGIILAGIPALAQNETTDKYEEVVIPQALEQPIDSLLDEWKVKHYVLASDSDCMKGSNPYFPDSVYIDRLVKMPTVMEMARSIRPAAGTEIPPHNRIGAQPVGRIKSRSRRTVAVHDLNGKDIRTDRQQPRR